VGFHNLARPLVPGKPDLDVYLLTGLDLQSNPETLNRSTKL
jgi:hypothetical protein